MARKTFLRTVMAIALALAVVSPVAAQTETAQTQTIDTSKFTADQLKQLNTLVDSTKTTADKALDTANKLAEVVDPEKMSQWAEFGKNIGSSIASAAKEIGIAAKDFANTPLGVTAVVVIIYKIFQSEIVGLFDVLIGLGILWFVTRTWNYYFKKLCMTSRTVVTTTEIPQIDSEGNPTGVVSKETKTEEIPLDIDNGAVVMYRIGMFVVLAITTIPAWIFLS